MNGRISYRWLSVFGVSAALFSCPEWVLSQGALTDLDAPHLEALSKKFEIPVMDIHPLQLQWQPVRDISFFHYRAFRNWGRTPQRGFLMPLQDATGLYDDSDHDPILEDGRLSDWALASIHERLHLMQIQEEFGGPKTLGLGRLSWNWFSKERAAGIVV